MKHIKAHESILGDIKSDRNHQVFFIHVVVCTSFKRIIDYQRKNWFIIQNKCYNIENEST